MATQTITAALVNGRHEMPTSNCIFNVVDDVKDYAEMDAVASSWIAANVGVSVVDGHALNTASYIDAPIYTGDAELRLYVTGLSAALAAVIKACALNGVRLVLLHYDRESRAYAEQRIF